MPILAFSAALGAAFFWAAGSLIAHRPARILGAWTFTHIQLVSCSILLFLIVSFMGSWSSIDLQTWPAFVGSAIFGVIFSNLSMIACLRRGGPRRMGLLMATNPVLVSLLGFIVLGETLSLSSLLGGGLTLLGVVLAILFGQGKSENYGDDLVSPLWQVVLFGLVASLCQGVGILILKPVMLGSIDPLASSFLRTVGAAVIITVITFWKTPVFQTINQPKLRLIFWTILPGIMGYIIAVTLQLYALKIYESGVVAMLGATAPVMILPLLWVQTRRRPSLLAWMGACLTIGGVVVLLNG